MKIFVVEGYGLNPAESCLETYAIVCTSREDAEKRLETIVEEQVMVAKSEICNGIQCTETIYKKNGNIDYYLIQQRFDLRKSEHRESFLWSTLVVAGNIKLDEFHPVFDEDSDRPEYRTMAIASISIREQEL